MCRKDGTRLGADSSPGSDGTSTTTEPSRPHYMVRRRANAPWETQLHDPPWRLLGLPWLHPMLAGALPGRGSARVQGDRRRARQESPVLRPHPSETALGLFATCGLAGTSMEQVRRDAGVSNGSLYHHFPSRSALAARLLVEGMNRSQQAVLDAVGSTDHAESAVRGVVTAQLGWVEAHTDWARLLFGDLPTRSCSPRSRPSAPRTGTTCGSSTAGGGARSIEVRSAISRSRWPTRCGWGRARSWLGTGSGAGADADPPRLPTWSPRAPGGPW